MASLDAAVDRLLAVTSNDELQRILAEEPSLLTQEAEASVAARAEKAQSEGDAELAERAGALRDLLNRVRSSPHFTLPDLPGSSDAADAIMNMLHMEGGEVVSTPDLSPTFFAVLASFQKQAKEQGAKELARSLARLQRQTRQAKDAPPRPSPRASGAAPEEPRQAPASEDVLRRLLDWLNASTWEASRAFLQKHPELMTEEGAQALVQLMVEYRNRGDEAAMVALVEHHDIRQQAQREGIDAAYAGRTGPKDQAPDPILGALRQWVNAPTWEESRDFLQAHPTLLTEEAATALAQVTESFRKNGDERAVNGLMGYQDILEQARRQGIEAAFAGRTGAKGGEPSPVLQALQAWINTPTWAESQKFLQAHPELLTDEAAAALAEVVEDYRRRGDEQSVRGLGEHQAILEQGRREGVEAAYAARAAGAEDDPTLQTLQDWVNTPTWEASRTFLQAHPELLTEEAGTALAQTVDNFRNRGDERMVRGLTEHLAILAQARREGVEAAYTRRLAAEADAVAERRRQQEEALRAPAQPVEQVRRRRKASPEQDAAAEGQRAPAPKRKRRGPPTA